MKCLFKKGKLVRLLFVKPQVIAMIKDVDHHTKTATLNLYDSTKLKFNLEQPIKVYYDDICVL